MCPFMHHRRIDYNPDNNLNQTCTLLTFVFSRNNQFFQHSHLLSVNILPVVIFCLCFTTDSNPNCSADSEGGPSGLPKAVAGAHSHSAWVSKGSGWLATAQSAAYLLPRHKNAGIQAPGTGQKAFPGRKSTLLCFCGKSFFKNSFGILHLVEIWVHLTYFVGFFHCTQYHCTLV